MQVGITTQGIDHPQLPPQEFRGAIDPKQRQPIVQRVVAFAFPTCFYNVRIKPKLESTTTVMMRSKRINQLVKGLDLLRANELGLVSSNSNGNLIRLWMA